MTSIIALADSGLQLSQTQASMSYGAKLAIGQEYEQALAQRITQLGIPCRVLKQRFVPSDRLQRYRRSGNEKLLRVDQSLYRSHQVDLMMKLGDKARIVEVKALTGAAFSKRWIHIGLTQKYDDKVLPIHHVVLINQSTGQAYVCPPKRLWGIDYAIYGPKDPYKKDYTVERSQLVPLEAWVQDMLSEGSRSFPKAA